MRKILRKYPEATLIVLALVFLAALFVYYSWGISEVVTQMNRAVNPTVSGSAGTSFNLQGAQALDLRGLVKSQP